MNSDFDECENKDLLTVNRTWYNKPQTAHLATRARNKDDEIRESATVLFFFVFISFALLLLLHVLALGFQFASKLKVGAMIAVRPDINDNRHDEGDSADEVLPNLTNHNRNNLKA